VDHKISIATEPVPKLIFDLVFWTKGEYFLSRTHDIQEDGYNQYKMQATEEVKIKQFLLITGKKHFKLLPPLTVYWSSKSHKLELFVNYTVL